ncbi:MAG: hypothetical protein WC655_27460 [Candidatus Hydrogenedentales bacterium]
MYFVAMCLLVRSEEGNALDECLTVGGEPMTVEELSRECGFRYVRNCQEALDSLMSEKRQLIEWFEVGDKRYLKVSRFRANQNRIRAYQNDKKAARNGSSKHSRGTLDTSSAQSPGILGSNSDQFRDTRNFEQKGVTRQESAKAPIYRSSPTEKKNYVDTVPGKREKSQSGNGERERCDQSHLTPEERISEHEKLHGPLAAGARDALLSSLKAAETDRLRRAAKAPKQAGNLGVAVVQQASDDAEDNTPLSTPTDGDAWAMTREEKQRLVDRCIKLTGDAKSDGNWWRITYGMCATQRGFNKMLQILQQFEDDASTKDPRATPMLHKGKVLTSRFNAVLGTGRKKAS